MNFTNELTSFRTIELRRGFTLIELMLYVSLSSILLLSVSAFISASLELRVKNLAVSKVEQEGTRAMNMIAQTMRNAEGINSPLAGAIASTASIDVVSAGSDPTVFDLSGGAIRMAEGAGSAIALTSNRVSVSGLAFSNLTKTGTDGNMRIEFTVSYINASGRNEFDYSKTFRDSASIRF